MRDCKHRWVINRSLVNTQLIEGSKQLICEPDARFVGYGSMLIEGLLATLVILACGAGLSLGTGLTFSKNDNQQLTTSVLIGDKDKRILESIDGGFLVSDPTSKEKSMVKITKTNANQLTDRGLFFDAIDDN